MTEVQNEEAKAEEMSFSEKSENVEEENGSTSQESEQENGQDAANVSIEGEENEPLNDDEEESSVTDSDVNPDDWNLNKEDPKSIQSEAEADQAVPDGMPSAAQEHQLEDLGLPHTVTSPHSLDFILDIPLHVTVEVGRAEMEIGELLQLGPGSIVELDKLAGEPLEVFVNDKLVARGEAVIVNEKFGIRLTDVISKVERIENLK